MKFNEKYLEFKKGTLPIIISVPHGGILECKEIPKKLKGVMGTDKETINLAKELIEMIIKESKYESPSYIFLKVRRSKIDLNRDEIYAFDQRSLLAKKIYRFYHSKLREMIDSNIINFKKSILIDIHGFEKHKRPQGYRDVEIVLGTNNLKTISSKKVSISQRDKNLRGKLIKNFNNLEIPIAPGRPRRKEYILTGGYIIQNHGASVIEGSQGVQIEFSDTIRIHNKELRNIALKTITNVLIEEL